MGTDSIVDDVVPDDKVSFLAESPSIKKILEYFVLIFRPRGKRQSRYGERLFENT